MSEQKKIILFYQANKPYGYMSNFAMFPIVVDNQVFCCNEQYIMFRKAKLFKDALSMSAILDARDPSVIKALGRKVKNFDQETWDKNINEIADTCNLHKFFSHPALKQALLETGVAILAEASPNDKIWGIGIDRETGKDIGKWRGTNILGESLMRVRNILMSK